MLVCPCCDSQACSIQPPTLCTCHVQLRPPSRLTSEEAGYTPTCPAGCDQSDEQSFPSMQLLWESLRKTLVELSGHARDRQAARGVRYGCFRSSPLCFSLFQPQSITAVFSSSAPVTLSHALWPELGSLCGSSDRRKQK